MEAGEPEERAAEENEVEENEGDRKAEKMGSEARESRAEDVGLVTLTAPVEGFLKVERRWIGDAVADTGDLAAAGDAIAILFCERRRPSCSLHCTHYEEVSFSLFS